MARLTHDSYGRYLDRYHATSLPQPPYEVPDHQKGCRLPYENKADQRPYPAGEILRVRIQPDPPAPAREEKD